ncbi:hypothetical protein B0H13DRAFT_2315204 [Mycena leptocephala]|nr:hypothetical protein B0H13DRAFT_2315204 [Mycena leptocephala]
MDPVSPRKPHPHSVDLLRNRSLTLPLGPFDGTVGAFAQIGAQHYFITSNADYVPALPSITVPHAVFLHSDIVTGRMTQRSGPSSGQLRSRPELDVMWDPLPTDFTVGSAVMRGLGRLTHARFSRLLPPINELVARCKELHRTSPALAIPLFGALIQHITMWLEQLQTLPTTYPKMVFGLTSLQRAFLELDALYNYMTIYQARMNNYMAPISADTSVAKFVGCSPLSPLLLSSYNILKVVPLREPEFDLPDANAHGAGAPPSIQRQQYLGKDCGDQVRRLHTPWYHDPFETTDTRARSPSPEPATPLASSSRSAVHLRSSVPVALGSPPVARNCPQQSRSKPYSGKPPAPKGPVKTERDKFSPLLIQEMPPSIVSMANALALDADKRYVLPNPRCWSTPPPTPATSAPTGVERRLGGPSDEVRPCRVSKVQGSERLLDCIRPALQACHLSSVEGFPVPVECLPEFSIEQTREIVWQVAETSFRFEFCSLDRRASQKNRLDEVKACFAGHMLVGMDSDSDAGLDDPITSPKYYPSCCRPYHELVPNRHGSSGKRRVLLLHTSVLEHFGRAAVVPLRLDHELEKEDGEL